LIRRDTTELCQREIAHQDRPVGVTELVRNCSTEFAQPHQLASENIGSKSRCRITREQVIRNAVRNDIEPLEYCKAVAHLAHDHGDRSLQSIGHRSENFRTRLFLPALNLTEIPQRNACLARDLAQGASL